MTEHSVQVDAPDLGLGYNDFEKALEETVRAIKRSRQEDNVQLGTTAFEEAIKVEMVPQQHVIDSPGTPSTAQAPTGIFLANETCLGVDNVMDRNGIACEPGKNLHQSAKVSEPIGKSQSPQYVSNTQTHPLDHISTHGILTTLGGIGRSNDYLDGILQASKLALSDSKKPLMPSMYVADILLLAPLDTRH